MSDVIISVIFFSSETKLIIKMSSMVSNSYLSEYVHNIFVKRGQNIYSDGNHCITPRLTYDWGKINDDFGGVDEDLNVVEQPEQWFLVQAEVVWKAVHEAAAAVITASPSQKQDLCELCDWACDQLDLREFLDCVELDTFLGVLQITACLERALGNVYLTKSSPVPFLLRDLLKSAELRSVFGQVPIVFTQVLLGSPKGINLRNVMWHGFVSPGELHPHIVSGLLVLLASLGEILSADLVVPRRLLFSQFDSFQEQLKDVFPNIINESEYVLNIIKTSPYISQNYQIYWERAYQNFQQLRFGNSLILLLPQLEHCLRTMYCKVNHCPSRLLTAEATTLYTTLDDILAPSHNSGLTTELGEGLLMMLLDLTTSMSGPRLRDRLSHGECDLSAVPQWLVNHTFCVALSTAHHHKDFDVCESKSLCMALKSASSLYHSQFHPTASLRRFIKISLAQLTDWQYCSVPAGVTLNPTTSSHIFNLDQRLFSSGGEMEEKVQAVRAKLCHANPPTLYRPKSETDFAAGLASAVACLMKTVTKVQEASKILYNRWSQRQLRSRARATALRLWAVLPDLWTAFICALQIVTLCLQILPTLALHCDANTKLLKSLKKAVDNTLSLCDCEKNRWTEAHAVLSSWASTTLNWLSMHSDLLNI